ncbi:hypothetical protein DRJ04_07695 [Candidatus Aerophobetes bacterium]|uniref:Uncharacterized protein n=1 Tax=Aerophobetes bacterium TaxID=2030807 RepID=A0A662D865_UNCAE|nr:MAG: hypothetical protein DRJ04_07695 [Candidatus Aerophobetes bacterium]
MRKRKLSLIAVGVVSAVLIVAFSKVFPSADSYLFNLFHTLLKNETQKVMQEERAGERIENLSSEENVSVRIKSTLTSPPPPENKIIPPVTIFSGKLRRGDTLYDCLRRGGVSPQRIYHISRSLKSVFNPKDCKPGDRVILQKSGEEGFLTVKYFPGGLNYYLLQEIEPGVFSVSKEKIPAKKILIGAKGKVRSSLYDAMKKEGLDNELILKFADIFSWEVDFLTDPRQGDTFELIWERYVSLEGKVLMEGRILAAEYINQGKSYTAIFYRDPEGHQGYFTPEGTSLRKSFLRSPLNYRRISSYFSYRRFHPILKIYRPHPGIDYAAPTGTPVSSIGEGVVIFAGWKGGFGRFVKIKHPNGYITSYGHLSRIAKGIRRGKKVAQGQVIGYVGATGLATGPHLDFRIAKNGRYLNFLRLKLPRAASVKSVYLEDFNKHKEVYVYYLEILSKNPENILVLLEEDLEKKKLVSSPFSPALSPSTHFPELLPLSRKKERLI